MNDMQKCYSADGEDFHYLEVGEVFDLLDNEGELVAGQVYYEANCKRVTPGDLIRAHNVIDSIFDAMLDEVGEVAESYARVAIEAESELQQLLEEWITRHANPSAFFRIIGKPRELAVTQHDVNDFNRAEPKGTAP